MECEKIRDMIQLYVEGLCGEASAKWIENHVENCEDCKAYLQRQLVKVDKDSAPLHPDQEQENSSASTPTLEEIKKELKPFKKLKRKLWFRCILDVAAILLCCIVLISVVIAAMTGWKAIENYELQKQAKYITQELLEGNTDAFFHSLDTELIYLDQKEGLAQWEADCKNNLKAFYDTILKDQTFSTKTTVESYYVNNWSYSSKSVSVSLKGDKNNLLLEYAPGDSGKLKFVGCSSENGTENYYDYFGILLDAEAYCYYANKVYSSFTFLNDEENQREMPPFFQENGSVSTETAEVWERLQKLLQSGMTIEKISSSGFSYSSSLKSFYTTLTIRVKSPEGQDAILEQEIKIPSFTKAEGEPTVIGDGISEEFRSLLEELF